MLKRIEVGGICGGSYSSAQIGKDLIPRLKIMQETGSASPALSGVSTGFPSLDGLIDGLHAGELIVVAGRPCMCEDNLVRQIALHVAINQGIRVAYFSTEKSREVVLRNLITLDARIGLHDLRRNSLSEEEWQRFTTSADRICGAPIIINDISADPEVLRKEVKKLCTHSMSRPSLIIFDKVPSGDDSRSAIGRKLSTFSKYLIEIARNNNVPVIALAGISRGVEKRKCKSPMLKDVASIDGIHWSADTVITLVRDSIYDPDTEFPDFAQVSVLKSFYAPCDGGFQLECNQRSGYLSEIPRIQVWSEMREGDLE